MSGVGLIILAAGSSSRLGRPKQLLEFRGQSLLRQAVKTALVLDGGPVVVVLGADAGLLEPELAGLAVLIEKNSAWEAGLGSSIRAGIRCLVGSATESNAAILMLCDQPLVTPAHLNRLIEAGKESGRGIVASGYGGDFGVPVLFTQKYFKALATIEENEGAHMLIMKHLSDVKSVPFPEGSFDVNTEEDYQALLQKHEPAAESATP